MAGFWDIGASGLMGAGMSFLGSSSQNASNAKIAAKQMAFEAAEAQKNRDFQATMASSAHQREMSDLQMAGLNPILSGTGGPGAATPSGAKGSGAGIPAVDELGGAVHSAIAARRNAAEVKNIEADTDLKHTQRSYTSQQWNTSRADEGWINDQAAQTRLRTAIERESLPGAQTEGRIDRSAYGQGTRYLDRIGKTIGSALGARRLFQQGEAPDPRPRYRGGPWRN